MWEQFEEIIEARKKDNPQTAALPGLPGCGRGTDPLAQHNVRQLNAAYQDRYRSR